MKLWQWLKAKFHRHDFDMEFPDKEHPLDYVLKCKCGATTRDMYDALVKTGRL